MKAIQYHVTVPRYAAGLALGKLSKRIYTSGLSCTTYDEVPDPALPGEDWAVLGTRLGGICGSDTSAIYLKASPYFSPLVSSPYTFGHENYACIAEVGKALTGEWRPGERVVVEPTLWCAPRGFTSLCRFCAQGEVNRCERVTGGNLAPGLGIGSCRDTCGSWAPFFLAHRSQLYHLPDSISDENALMIEPFAVGLHAALQNLPRDGDKILIVGAGSIGLCMLAALRALGVQSEILILARHGFQAEAARKLGASQVIRATRDTGFYDEIAGLTGASLKQPLIGKSWLLGGVELIFECVGSRSALDDALRLTHNGGRVVVVGLPGVVKDLDWTPIFIKELEVRGAYAYHHADQFQGKRWKTFDLAIDLMARGKVDLGWMVTHKFAQKDYQQALDLTHKRSSEAVVKIAFQFD
jgi:threonine dehydrogenase-like Zn-dependent dehydrogenase